MSLPPPVSPNPIDADVSSVYERKAPPKRYALLGFGCLAVFVMGTYALTIHQGGHVMALISADEEIKVAPPSSAAGNSTAAQVVAPSPSIDAAFVRSAQALEGVHCLEAATNPLDNGCRTAATTAITRFVQIVKRDIVSNPSGLDAKARTLRPAAIQLQQLTLSALSNAQRTTKSDLASQLSLQAFASAARSYVSSVNTAFDLSAPRWKSADEPGSDTGSAADVEKPSAPVEESPAEAPKPESTAVGEKAGQPAAGEHVATGTDSTGDEPHRDVTLITSLVSSVRNVQRSFENAEHDPARVIDAVMKSRPALEKVDEDLQRYRAAPHGDESAQGQAQAFIQRIDQARGHLLRAGMELQHATVVTAVDEPVFRKADELVEKAAEDVRLAEILAKTAP